SGREGGERPMNNPYLIPGLEDTPTAPLCPHANDSHHRYYVAVDDTESEFRRFQDMMNPVKRLTQKGRLVVVTRQRGCAQTSLCHPCAAWLRDQLAGLGSRVVIFPLAESAKPHESIMFRMEQVITDIIEYLGDEQHEVMSQHIETLNIRINELKEITRIRS